MRWPWSRQAEAPAETRADIGDSIEEWALERAAGAPADLRRLSVAEACAGVYGRAFAAARVEGADGLTPGLMDLIGRALLFHGEFIGAILADGMIAPASSADVMGRSPDPREWGYRLYVPSPYAGSEQVLAPADAVLHVRVGGTIGTPWRGRSPLKGAMSDAELALAGDLALKGESAIKSYAMLSIDREDKASVAAEFLGVLADRIKNSPNGRTFFAPERLQTDRVKPDPPASIDAARRTSAEGVAAAAGVPTNLLRGDGDGAASRESYRRLVRATIEPLGRILADEASLKLGRPVSLDFAALRASDTAMQARAADALGRLGVPTREALYIAGLIEEGQ